MGTANSAWIKILNPTKSMLVGLQCVVKKVVGLGGRHWLIIYLPIILGIYHWNCRSRPPPTVGGALLPHSLLVGVPWPLLIFLVWIWWIFLMLCSYSSRDSSSYWLFVFLVPVLFLHVCISSMFWDSSDYFQLWRLTCIFGDEIFRY